MCNRVFRNAAALALLLTICCPSFPALAQKGEDVPALIRKLEGKTDEEVMRAAGALARLGPSVIPALEEGMRRRRGCQFLYVASGVVYRIDKDKRRANPVLSDVVLGRCEGSSKRDLMVRRVAAFALVERAEGVPVVAQLFRDGESFDRQTAAFAFDELTEKIRGSRPDGVEAAPELLRALKEALPLIVGALGDGDEVVRCMSLEAIEQARAAPAADVRTEVERLMRGVTVRCSR